MRKQSWQNVQLRRYGRFGLPELTRPRFPDISRRIIMASTTSQIEMLCRGTAGSSTPWLAKHAGDRETNTHKWADDRSRHAASWSPKTLRLISACVTLVGALFLVRFALGVELPADVETKLDVVYSESNGEKIALDAYLQKSPGPHLAAVFVHGGGFIGGDKHPCPHYILEPFLGHGYSVISVNYRLSPQHRFPAAIDDVKSAIHFVRAHSSEWRLDPKRLVLTGESAGGLITGLVGATLIGDDRVAAVVSMCGEFDLELRVAEDPCHVNGQSVPCPPGGCISPGLAAFFGFDALTTDDQRATLREASTVDHLHADMPPYLLIHGTRDSGVPYEQSVSMQQAMMKIGADCTLLPVIRGGHGNWTREQWQTATDAELVWLEQRIGHL
jgi:acetyl esterase/lipase